MGCRPRARAGADASRVEPAFLDLIMTGTLPKGDALVPGCGRGYAVAALGSAERKVTGLEISATAKAAADTYLSTAKAGDGSAASEHCTVVVDDFFTHTGRYDLVYDCTFLCAIPPSRREEWAARMSKLIKPGGEIVSLVFPLGDYEGRTAVRAVNDNRRGFTLTRGVRACQPDQGARGEACANRPARRTRRVPLPLEKALKLS